MSIVFNQRRVFDVPYNIKRTVKCGFETWCLLEWKDALGDRLLWRGGSDYHSVNMNNRHQIGGPWSIGCFYYTKYFNKKEFMWVFEDMSILEIINSKDESLQDTWNRYEWSREPIWLEERMCTTAKTLLLLDDNPKLRKIGKMDLKAAADRRRKRNEKRLKNS